MDRSTKTNLIGTKPIIHVNRFTGLTSGSAIYTNLFTKGYITIRDFASANEKNCFDALKTFCKLKGDADKSFQSSDAGDTMLIEIYKTYEADICSGAIGIPCVRSDIEGEKKKLQAAINMAIYSSNGGLGTAIPNTPAPTPAATPTPNPTPTPQASQPSQPTVSATPSKVMTNAEKEKAREAEIKAKYTKEQLKTDFDLKKKLVEKMIDFFKEFGFNPGNRYINTIANIAVEAGETKATSKISKFTEAYFKLSNNPNTQSIVDKMKSQEWQVICVALSKVIIYKKVNQRLAKIYFGPAGSGKTTSVLKDHPGIDVIVADPSMLPSDLLENFDYIENSQGDLMTPDMLEVTNKEILQAQLTEELEKLPEEEKAVLTNKIDTVNMNTRELVKAIRTLGSHPKFIPSVLMNAMVSGTEVLIDEINLMPLICLRTLQGYLDNKEYFIFKGNKIFIKDGFKVYGTMNLSDNGEIWPLPTALVDRCVDIEEFIATPQMLATYAF